MAEERAAEDKRAADSTCEAAALLEQRGKRMGAAIKAIGAQLEARACVDVEE